jgi:phosphoserine phosphatase
MAEKYNVTDFIGSDYIFENEIFNGTVIPMWDSASKNTAIDNFIEKYDIDLSKSYAYGDTNGDINMLRRVGNPIAINPTKELINHISSDEDISKRTKIIVERKDIVYSLSPNINILDI